MKRYEIPDGWTARGFSFEVEWPSDRSAVLSHFGARRKAKNWAIAQVKADMDAKKLNPEHESVGWNLPALRKEWNQAKSTVAPWWAQNSKEAYSSGIADAVRALDNWRASRAGKRAGKPVGFPRFESKRKGHDAVRFTTGTLRVEADRRTITLPVIGSLVSKENTRRLERHVRNGTGKILSATLSRRGDRLFVAFATIVQQQRPSATEPQARAGVDLGLRTLATVADSDGQITEYPNPAPLRATLNDRRRAGRQMSRRIVGSKGWRAAKAKLQAMDFRAASIRKDAAHKLTTDLASTYGTVVIEDLDVAAMKRSMGRRSFRRAVSDSAIGAIRPMLVYKTAWHGGSLVVADRWFPSSKIHHGCGCRLIEPRKLAKQLACAVTGEIIDRDVNAAKNLRDWPDNASTGTVGARAPQVALTGDGGQAPRLISERGRNRKTSPQKDARSVEARTVTGSHGDGTSRRGAA
jgi:putative transposase